MTAHGGGHRDGRRGGRRGDGTTPRLSRARPLRWARWLPPVLLVALATLQEATPPSVELGFLLAATPPLAALAYGPLVTAFFGGIVLLLLSLYPGMSGEDISGTDIAAFAFVALLSFVIAWVRTRRDAQLVTVRSVAEAAQLAVLPPLAERVEGVRCAGLYRAAQDGTLIGGDLYDVRQGPYGVRALLADVQGHGLAAVGTVAAMLGAFREAVLDEPELDGVAAKLDRRLVLDSAAIEHAELFATAVLLEFPDGSPVVRVLSCGHPAPLLLRRGAAAAEVDAQPGPPLGLGLTGYSAAKARTLALAPGDRLFTHTDGLTEARDAAGTYYPLLERIDALPDGVREGTPAELADAVWQDLVRFAGAGHVRDDVALLVLAPNDGS